MTRDLTVKEQVKIRHSVDQISEDGADRNRTRLQEQIFKVYWISGPDTGKNGK